MLTHGLSLRELCQHTIGRASGPVGLREAVRRNTRPLRLSYSPAAFSVMAHNMALLPALYKGTDRSGAIGQIVAQILAARPTLAGLSEVWVGDERNQIREAVAPWYPHSVDGPEAHLPKVYSGGLLLLSSEPIVASSSMIYSHCDKQDCLTAKGVLHMRLATADVFLSHTQDILTSHGAAALYGQLDELNAFVESQRDPALTTLIMGDLNIPGEEPGHYYQLIQKLGNPMDCWTALGNVADSGYTEIVDSNFYRNSDDRPKVNQRLDYVLLKPGSGSVAILSATDVLTFTNNGRFISDHFGIAARFRALCTFA